MYESIIEPMENRLDFFEIMQPDKGYTIDKIIITTYSLDMNTLIGLLILLGANSEELRNKSKVELLYILSNMKDKVLLFCQAGKINNSSRLEEKNFYYFLENIINPIKLKNRKSFHPKTYLIRYKEIGKDTCKYKFIVMSKNLTFSKNWELSISLDGKVDTNVKEEDTPVYEFYKYLLTENTNNLKNFETIIKELKKVKFKNDLGFFDNIEFFPMGIEAKYTSLIQKEILYKKYKKAFIISPFLSDNIVKIIYTNGDDKAERILISREDSFGKLINIKQDIRNLKTYKLKDKIINVEEELGDDDIYYKNEDIHAKLYLFELENNTTEMFVGSANESSNAFLENGNIEFMVKLTTKKALFDIFKNNLLYDKEEKYFDLVEIKEKLDENIEQEDNFEEVINIINYLNIDSKIKNDFKDDYTICLKISEDLHNLQKYNIKIYPLTNKNKEKQFSKEMEFNGLKLEEITKFFAININDKKEFVIKIPMEGNILIEREKQLRKGIVETEKDFLEYISYLLGDTSTIYMIRNFLKKDSNQNIGKYNSVNQSGLYERTLKALCKEPNKIKELSDFINSMKETKNDKLQNNIRFFEAVLSGFEEIS